MGLLIVLLTSNFCLITTQTPKHLYILNNTLIQWRDRDAQTRETGQDGVVLAENSPRQLGETVGKTVVPRQLSWAFQTAQTVKI
jgi:hypothetical protein